MKTSKKLALKNGSNFHTHLLTSNTHFSYEELERQNSFEIFLTSDAIITHHYHALRTYCLLKSLLRLP